MTCQPSSYERQEKQRFQSQQLQDSAVRPVRLAAALQRAVVVPRKQLHFHITCGLEDSYAGIVDRKVEQSSCLLKFVHAFVSCQLQSVLSLVFSQSGCQRRNVNEVQYRASSLLVHSGLGSLAGILQICCQKANDQGLRRHRFQCFDSITWPSFEQVKCARQLMGIAMQL